MPEGFDSLLAKIISWAPSRDEAIFKLDTALDETIILGVDTLIPLHREILNEKDFKNREITIDYLQIHPELQSRSN
jgi:biotin carboxylase